MRLLTHMGVGCLSLMMCFSSFSDLSAHSSSGGHKHKHKHKHHKSSQCEIYCPPPVVVAPSFGNFYTTALSAVTSGSAVVFNASQSNSPDITLNIDEDGIVVATAGVYFVNFGASNSTGATSLAVSLAINGNQVAGANVSSEPQPNGLLTSSTVVSVNAGDVLSVKNIGGSTITLGTGYAGGTTAVISLYRVALSD